MTESGLPNIAQPLARRTAGEQVTEVLREAIVQGLFADGQVLNQEQIAQQFSLSRLPVREALRQLQAEGLVTLGRQRSVVVVGFDSRRVADVFEIRALLECWLLERAASRLAPADIEELRERRAELLATDDPALWLERKHAFHHRLLAPADCPAAHLVIEQLTIQVERFVRRSVGFSRRAAVDRAYGRILDALVSGAVESACAELNSLLRETAALVLEGG
jgi:DNA-binding GntR family transcriptional regulator